MTQTRTLVSAKRGELQTNLTDEQALAMLATQPTASFAGKLVEDFNTKQRLSPEQWWWAHKIALESVSKGKKSKAVGNLSAINALFAKALERRKRPLIRLRTASGQGIRVLLNGSTSNRPGTLSITSDADYEDRTFYGRVELDGKWSASKACPADVIDVLARFAQDPAQVATEYGKATNNCCFCGHSLEEEGSVAIGYGPVCAVTFGLPHPQNGTMPSPQPEVQELAVTEKLPTHCVRVRKDGILTEDIMFKGTKGQCNDWVETAREVRGVRFYVLPIPVGAAVKLTIHGDTQPGIYYKGDYAECHAWLKAQNVPEGHKLWIRHLEGQRGRDVAEEEVKELPWKSVKHRVTENTLLPFEEDLSEIDTPTHCVKESVAGLIKGTPRYEGSFGQCRTWVNKQNQLQGRHFFIEPLGRTNPDGSAKMSPLDELHAKKRPEWMLLASEWPYKLGTRVRVKNPEYERYAQSKPLLSTGKFDKMRRVGDEGTVVEHYYVGGNSTALIVQWDGIQDSAAESRDMVTMNSLFENLEIIKHGGNENHPYGLYWEELAADSPPDLAPAMPIERLSKKVFCTDEGKTQMQLCIDHLGEYWVQTTLLGPDMALSEHPTITAWRRMQPLQEDGGKSTALGMALRYSNNELVLAFRGEDDPDFKVKVAKAMEIKAKMTASFNEERRGRILNTEERLTAFEIACNVYEKIGRCNSLEGSLRQDVEAVEAVLDSAGLTPWVSEIRQASGLSADQWKQLCI